MADILERAELKWTPDCQGKQDYDGSVVSVSTRYWPRGGGFHASYIVPGQPVVWQGNEARPEIKPSAKSSIMLFDEELAKKEFEAETEDEVKAMVEHWVRTQLLRIERHLKALWAKGGLRTDDYAFIARAAGRTYPTEDRDWLVEVWKTEAWNGLRDEKTHTFHVRAPTGYLAKLATIKGLKLDREAIDRYEIVLLMSPLTPEEAEMFPKLDAHEDP